MFSSPLFKILPPPLLSYQLSASLATVSRTLLKWINLTLLRFTLVALQSDWSDIEAIAAFKLSYHNTVAIINATELNAKSLLPSHCSLNIIRRTNEARLKGLVAIAPNSTCIFLGELFGGSLSNQALFEQSGLRRLLDSVPPRKERLG